MRHLLIVFLILVATTGSAIAADAVSHEVEKPKPRWSFGLSNVTALFSLSKHQASAMFLPKHGIHWYGVNVSGLTPLNEYCWIGGHLLIGPIYSAENEASAFEIRVGGLVRVFAIPRWLFFDTAVQVGIPAVWVVTQSLGVSIPVNDNVRFDVLNRFPMTSLLSADSILIGYEPSIQFSCSF